MSCTAQERAPGAEERPAQSFPQRIKPYVSKSRMNTIRVRVVTGSSRPRVEEQAEGCFKVYVSSPPEKGRANAEMMKMLAEHLGVPRRGLEIMRGRSSREKVIEIRQD